MAKAEKALGQLVRPDKKLNLPYEYYMTIQKSDGKVLAFPVKSKKVKIKGLKLKKQYLVDFEPETENLTLGETKQKVTIMNIISAKEISLTDLQASTNTDNIQKGRPKDPRQKQDVRINDKLTNAIIYTAGAILLGSIIAN